MEFRDNEAIYLQIASYLCEQITLNKLPEDKKLPSVRELAAGLQVNPNTVMRSFEFLQGKDVIVNKRGIGFYAAEDAEAKIISYQKERFLNQDLPEFFRTIYLLNISIEEIEQRFETYKKDHFQPKP